MNRRITILTVTLVIALVLGIQYSSPKITWAAANATDLSIDTTPFWDGTQYISSFGMPNTATYGQTISMTESGTLTQFSFYMRQNITTVFRGYVFAWDGLKATGNALFESQPTSTTQATNYEEVVFKIPPGVFLNAGQQYVLFASTSKDPGQPNDAGRWGSVSNTSYVGGQFVYLNNGTDPTLWTTTNWSTITEDLAFKAKIERLASIDTTPYWDRIQYISSFGMPNTATYGQTITMRGPATLEKFSFFMKLNPTTVFRGFVFEWDGLKAIGDPLFQSLPMSTVENLYFEEIEFTIPGGLVLNAGQKYVLFASTSKDPAQPNNAGQWGAISDNTVYNEGQLVWLNNGADPSQWTSMTWSTIPWDMAFKAALKMETFIPLINR